MKQKLIDWLISILTPVVKAAVREAMIEVKAELVPQYTTINNAVTSIDNNINQVLGVIAGIPNLVLTSLGKLNPLSGFFKVN